MKICQCGVSWKPSKCEGNMNNKCGHIQTQPDTRHPTMFTEQRSNEMAHTDTSWNKTSQCVHKTALKWNGTHRHKLTQDIPMCSQNSAQMKRHKQTQADIRHPNVFTKQLSNETAHTDTSWHKTSHCVHRTALKWNSTYRHKWMQDIPLCSQISAQMKRHIQTQADATHPNVFTEQHSNQTGHTDTSWHKTSQRVHKTALKWNSTSLKQRTY